MKKAVSLQKKSEENAFSKKAFSDVIKVINKCSNIGISKLDISGIRLTKKCKDKLILKGFTVNDAVVTNSFISWTEINNKKKDKKKDKVSDGEEGAFASKKTGKRLPIINNEIVEKQFFVDNTKDKTSTFVSGG